MYPDDSYILFIVLTVQQSIQFVSVMLPPTVRYCIDIAHSRNINLGDHMMQLNKKIMKVAMQNFL